MENIAVIAHDKLKNILLDFLIEKKEWLDGAQVLATGRTAEFIESQVPDIRHLSQGRYGGYNELTALVKEGKVDLVLFFRDHKVKYHHNDIQDLLDACDEYNVPVATNPASAERLIVGHLQLIAIERNKLKREVL
jgi:methylglyoxal synthase